MYAISHSRLSSYSLAQKPLTAYDLQQLCARAHARQRAPFRVSDEAAGSKFQQGACSRCEGDEGERDEVCLQFWSTLGYLLGFARASSLADKRKMRSLHGVVSHSEPEHSASRHPAGVPVPGPESFPPRLSQYKLEQPLLLLSSVPLRVAGRLATSPCGGTLCRSAGAELRQPAWIPRAGSTKATPKTHHDLRPEAAGSRHSLLHMREANRERASDRLARLQLPEKRTISSREKRKVAE